MYLSSICLFRLYNVLFVRSDVLQITLSTGLNTQPGCSFRAHKCGRDVIVRFFGIYFRTMLMQSCELEASGEKAAVSGENSDSIMRLAWALVHSRNAPDVQRGIAMLEGTS